MYKSSSLGRRIFLIFGYTFLIVSAVACLLPMINVLAISFSSSTAVNAGKVGFWPIDFTLESYKFVWKKPEFFTALLVSIQRVIVGVPVNMVLTILIAFPLSKETKDFKARPFYIWFFIITMLFSGGLIPWYMAIKMTGIMNTFWALILPGAVPVFNVILLINFFRSLPKEIAEAAYIDGASYWATLWKIYVPLSAPAIATLILFCIVTHWNSWFDGLILMNSPQQYPLQSYLQTVIVDQDINLMTSRDILVLSTVSDRTSKAAQVFLAALPVMLVYPFLQKYFTDGIVMGSVKG